MLTIQVLGNRGKERIPPPWFPAQLKLQRAEALVLAPAAFRKHGVYVSTRDFEAT